MAAPDISKAIARMREDGISEEQITRVVNKVTGSWDRGYEGNPGKAPVDRGALSSIGASIKRTAANTVNTLGNAAKAFTGDRGEGTAWGNQVNEDNAMSPEFANTWLGKATQIVEGAAPIAAGMVASAIAPPIAPVIGLGILPGVYGAEQFHRSSESALKNGMTPEQAQKAAILPATATAVGFAGMGAAGALGQRMLAPAVKATLGAGAVDLLSTGAAATAGRFATRAATDTALMTAQSGATAAAEKLTGARPDAQPMEEMIGGIGHSAIAAFMFSAHGTHAYNKQITKTVWKPLADPTADPAIRERAAAAVAEQITDPDQRIQFEQTAQERIAEGKSLLDTPVLGADGKVTGHLPLSSSAEANKVVGKMVKQWQRDSTARALKEWRANGDEATKAAIKEDFQASDMGQFIAGRKARALDAAAPDVDLMGNATKVEEKPLNIVDSETAQPGDNVLPAMRNAQKAMGAAQSMEGGGERLVPKPQTVPADSAIPSIVDPMEAFAAQSKELDANAHKMDPKVYAQSKAALNAAMREIIKGNEQQKKMDEAQVATEPTPAPVTKGEFMLQQEPVAPNDAQTALFDSIRTHAAKIAADPNATIEDKVKAFNSLAKVEAAKSKAEAVAPKAEPVPAAPKKGKGKTKAPAKSPATEQISQPKNEAVSETPTPVANADLQGMGPDGLKAVFKAAKSVGNEDRAAAAEKILNEGAPAKTDPAPAPEPAAVAPKVEAPPAKKPAAPKKVKAPATVVEAEKPAKPAAAKVEAAPAPGPVAKQEPAHKVTWPEYRKQNPESTAKEYFDAVSEHLDSDGKIGPELVKSSPKLQQRQQDTITELAPQLKEAKRQADIAEARVKSTASDMESSTSDEKAAIKELHDNALAAHKRAQSSVKQIETDLKDARAGIRFHVAEADSSEPVGKNRAKGRLGVWLNNNLAERRKADTIAASLEKAAKAEVYRNMASLPAEFADAKALAESRGHQRVEAFFHKPTGKLVFLTDNIKSLKRFEEVSKHELQHRGIKQVLGEKFGKHFDDIYKVPKFKEEIDALMAKLKVTDVHEGVDEFLSSRGEQYKDQGMIRNLISAAKHALRKMGFERPWSDSDVLSLAGKAIREGAKTSEASGDGTAFAALEIGPEHKFKQRKDGTYIGGPHHVTSEKQLKALRKTTRGMIEQGAPSSDWYEKNAEGIMKAAGGDQKKAEEVAMILAITSPQRDVKANTTLALKAIDEFERTGTVTGGGSANQIEQMLKAFNGDDSWGGRKISTFYPTLLSGVEGSRYNSANFKHGVTVDMWMMRALGFKSDAPTDAQYSFAETLISQEAAKIGLKPHQAQAAIWVSAIARHNAIETKLLDYAKGKGWMRRKGGGWSPKPEFAEQYADKRRALMDKADVPPGSIGANGPNYTKALARYEDRLGENKLYGANAEVAPNPNDAAKKAVWDALPAERKHEITGQAGKEYADKVFAKHSLKPGRDYTIEVTQGAYGKDINPSIHFKFGRYTAMDTIEKALKDFGYVMGQESVITFDAFDTAGRRGALVDHVKVEFPEGGFDKLYSELNRLEPDLVAGATRYGNSLSIGNFSESFGGPKVDKSVFTSKIKSALETLEGDYYLDHSSFYAKFHDTTEVSNGSNRQRVQSKGVPGNDGNGWRDSFREEASNRISELAGEDAGTRFSVSDSAGVVRPDSPGVQRTDERGFPIREDGRIPLTHWGKIGGIEELDPAKHGTGISGGESKRKKNDPSNWVDRTYFGVTEGGKGYKKEPGLGGHRYHSSIEPSALYDFMKDPDGLKSQSTDWGQFSISKYEKLIKDAGYKGYIMDHPQLGTTVAAFDKVAPERYINEATGEVGYDKRTGPEQPVVLGEPVPERAGDAVVGPDQGTENRSVEGSVRNGGKGGQSLEKAAGDVPPAGRVGLAESDGTGVKFSIAPPRNSEEFKSWTGGHRPKAPKSFPREYHRTQDTAVNAERHKNVGPGVYLLFHGTRNDISSFRTENTSEGNGRDSNGNRPVFLSPNPEWSGEYTAGYSYKGAADIANDYQRMLDRGGLVEDIESFTRSNFFDENVMPVWVRLDKPFEFWNNEHLDSLAKAQPWIVKTKMPPSHDNRTYLEAIKEGDWNGYADSNIQDALRKLGYDGYFENEDAVNLDKGYQTNVAAFDKNNIKSVIGNVGSYGQRPVAESEVKPMGLTADTANKLQADGDIRFSVASDSTEKINEVLSKSKFYTNDIKPGLKSAAEAVVSAAGGVAGIVAPASKGQLAWQSASVIRQRNAERAILMDRQVEAFKEARKVMDRIPGSMSDPNGIQANFVDAIQRGPAAIKKLPAELRDIANAIRVEQDKLLDMVRTRGRLENTLSSTERDAKNAGLDETDPEFIAYYFTGMWEKEGQDVAQRIATELMGKSNLEGTKSFLKSKTYQFLKDGLAAGLKPLYDNPIDMLHHNSAQIAKWVMAHDIMTEYKNTGLAKFQPIEFGIPKGWKKVEASVGTVFKKPEATGYKVRYTDANGDDHTKTFKPKALSADDYASMSAKQRADAMWADAKTEADAFARANNGKIEDGTAPGLTTLGHYIMPENAAKVFNNMVSTGLRGHETFGAAFRGYLGVSNVMNQVQLGFSLFHAGFTSMDANVSQFALGVHYLAMGSPLKAAQAFATSPTAFLTNAKIGRDLVKRWDDPAFQVSTGIDNYKGFDLTKMYAVGGGRAHMDEFYSTGMIKKVQQAFRQGNLIGAALRTPLAGIEAIAKPLMEHLVPWQKAGVFAKIAMMEIDKAEKAGVALTETQLRKKMGQAVDSVDNRLGQLVYDNLFWNKVFKDLSMASTRSVGWNLGTIRELGGGAVDWVVNGKKALTKGEQAELTTRMSYVVALPIMVGLVGAITQYMMTGQAPEELKDYFYPKTGGTDEKGNAERIVVPTYMKDVAHYASDPVKTVTNKIHPMLSTIADMIANKDYFGSKVYDEEDPIMQKLASLGKFTVKNMTPFAIAGQQKMADRGDSRWQQAANFVGITPAPSNVNQSKADRLMSKYAEENRKIGGWDAETTKVMEAKQKIKQAIRQKDEAKMTELINKAIEDKLILPAEVKQLIKDATSPPGKALFNKLTIHQAANVMKVATPAEKELFAPMLVNKTKSPKAALHAADIENIEF